MVIFNSTKGAHAEFVSKVDNPLPGVNNKYMVP